MKNSAKQCVGDLGNSSLSPPAKKKQVSPSKRWCFTLNNYLDSEKEVISSIVPEICNVYIVAEEVGESGTPHLQGYLEFKAKVRPLSKIPLTRIHWEKANGTKTENFIYCSKDEKVWMQGGFKLPKEIKIINDDSLYEWEKEIIDIVNKEPDERSIYWYWSNSGLVGKTSFCKYLTVKYGAIALSGKGNDVRNGVVNYMKENGQTPELVVFPIPRSHNVDYVSYEALENIKDMYFYSGKYEGGMVCGNCPHLIVFANQPPDTFKCSMDRWKIVNIDSDEDNEYIFKPDDDNDEVPWFAKGL